MSCGGGGGDGPLLWQAAQVRPCHRIGPAEAPCYPACHWISAPYEDVLIAALATVQLPCCLTKKTDARWEAQ